MVPLLMPVATVIGLFALPVGPGLYIAIVQGDIRMGPLFRANTEEGAEYGKVQAFARRFDDEHRELETTWKLLEPELKRVAKGQDSHLDVSAIERLVTRYRAHAEFEEKAFLPLSETILGRNSRHMAALGLSLHMRHHAPRKPATYI